MRGQINYVTTDASRPLNNYGFVRGTDGRMYWFYLVNANISVNDVVEFEAAEDEKGYFAKQLFFNGE